MLNLLNLITCSVLLSHFSLGATFIKGILPNRKERLDLGCLKHVGVTPRDILDCARECLLEDKCEGFCMDDDLKCYIHFHCKLPADPSDEVTYFERLATREDCLNTGSWKPQSQTCQCSGGIVGLRCERFAESCKELFQMGYPEGTRKPYFIKPPGLAPFLTHCANNGAEIRTDVFFHPAEGLLSFNRSLSDYVTGFYYNTSEFWIGLEKMYALNTIVRLTNICFYIMFNESSYFQFLFRGVAIGDASSDYAFNYTNVKYTDLGPLANATTVSNCLPKSGKPTPFSAHDTDNDAEQMINCAGNSGAGWWFSTCDPDPVCNPLGAPIKPGTVNVTSKHMMFGGLDLKAHASEFLSVRMYFFEPW